MNNTMMNAVYDLPYDEYRAMPRTSPSDVRSIAATSYQEWARGRGDTPDSEAMEDGTAIHCAVLEPEKFVQDYLAFDDADLLSVCTKADGSMPKNARLTKGYQTALAEYKKSLPPGKVSLSPARLQAISKAADMARTALPASITPEVSLFFSFAGREMKGRIDAIDADTGTVYDIKTTGDTKKFLKSWHQDRKYHIQLALYQHAITLLTGVVMPCKFVLVSSYGADVVVLTLAQATLDAGLKEARAVIEDMNAIDAGDYRQASPWARLPQDYELVLPSHYRSYGEF